MLFAGIFAFISAFIIIFNEYREFGKEVIDIEKEYMQSQRRVALQQALQLYRLVEYRSLESKDLSLKRTEELIAKEISIVLDDMDNGSYLFVFGSDKHKIYESKYANITSVARQEIVDTASKDGNIYNFMTTINGKNIENIAFVKKFEKLGWIIGSGVDLAQIQKVLELKRQEHSKKATGFILKIITLTLFLYLASILKYRYITDAITSEVKFIVASFKRASSDYHFIDVHKIKLKEFVQISKHANSMLAQIKEKNKALESLNANLEQLVATKTQELQQSVAYNRQLLADQDKFLKNAIHELNTPLSIILMNIDLYNMRFDKNQYLIKIQAAVKVLQNVYGDLSFIVKKDRSEFPKERISLSDFILERIEYFSDVALGNKIQLDHEIQEDLYVLFNELELQRLCDNNISNAIKYSYINETVFIKVYAKEPHIVFEVQNKGDKIEFEERVFDRYYREDQARGGFGLGLNIVKEICDKNGVKIEIRSDEESTIFRYFFTCKH